MRALIGTAIVATLAVPALSAGCSVWLDWSGYTGGGADAGDAATAGEGEDAGSGDAGTAPGPTCGVDLRCAEEAPPGWEGPVALFRGASLGELPACENAYAAVPVFEGVAGLDAGPASCSPCTCASPTGGACAAPEIAFFSDPGCATPCGSTATLTTPTCASPANCTTFQVGPPAVADAGTCVAAGGATTLPDVTWSQAARACAPAVPPSRGTCGTGDVCFPTQASGVSPRVCVMMTGEAATCPAGDYAVGPYVLHAGDVGDTRGCSACACDAPAASCAFPANPPLPGFRYIDANCAVMGIPFAVPSACVSVAAASGVRIPAAPVLDPGSCAPSGGQPTGAVTPPAAATSFCCTP